MELLYTILSTVHVFACFLLIFFILFQKGAGNGLFTTSAYSNSFMSGTEVANTVSTITKYLGIFFVINTLLLASLSVKISNQNKVLVEIKPQEQTSTKGIPTSSK